MTSNNYINKWIDEMAALTTPDKIVWIDGSEEQTDALKKPVSYTHLTLPTKLVV